MGAKKHAAIVSKAVLKARNSKKKTALGAKKAASAASTALGSAASTASASAPAGSNWVALSSAAYPPAAAAETAVVAVSKTEPAAGAATDELQADSERKKRRLNRRCSDEQVQRALQGRYGLLLPPAWEAKRDNHGRSLREAVKDGIKKSQAGGRLGRLSTKFWIALHEAFSLIDSVVSLLAQPPMDEEVDSELLGVIQVCGSTGVRGRSAQSL